MSKVMSTKTRERMVTRTIISCVYHCMVVTPDNKVDEEAIILGNVTNEKPEKVELILKERCENIFVKVNRMETRECVMGMSEDDFIRYAKVIER